MLNNVKVNTKSFEICGINRILVLRNKGGVWCIGCTRAFGTLGIAGSSPVAPTQI